MRMYHALTGAHAEGTDRTANYTIKRSPLEWRNVNYAGISSDAFYEIDTSMQKPPPKGWAHAFDAKGELMPRS